MPDTQSPAVGHTPESWDDCAQHPEAKTVLIFSKAEHVATVKGDNWEKVQIRARLVSAAPELLAALKDVLAAQAAGQLSYKSSGGCGYEAMLAVESAIAKAEGRAS